MRRKVTALTLACFFALSGSALAVIPAPHDQPGKSDCHGHSDELPPGIQKNNC
jgi:hypothetical protein